MNHDVEERLRDALRRHADEAPPGAAMLSAVASASARRRRRQLATSVAAAVLAVLAIAAPLAFTADTTPSPQVVGAPPSSGTAPPADQPTSLIASTPESSPTSISFPFTPPTGPGYGPPLISIAAAQPTLRQLLPDHTMATLTASSSELGLKLNAAKAGSSPAMVRGHPATVIDWTYLDTDPQVTGPQRTLVWQESPTTWLQLGTEPAVSPERLVEYAEALKPQPLQAPAPYTFKLVPAGFTIDNLDPAVITFCPPGTPPDQGFTGKIAVMLSLAADHPTPDPAATRVQVGNRPAWLTTSDNTTTLLVSTSPDRLLVIQESPSTSLSDPDLLRFAASISVTTAAQPGHG